MTEDIESGRPVSAQFPLRAAWKNGEANQRTSLCALSRSHHEWGSPDELDRHAPERRALDNNFNCPGECGALGERVVDVDGLPRVADADLGDCVLCIHPLDEPWR
jgi:hypothetical protein